jgi:hypothetical protein
MMHIPPAAFPIRNEETIHLQQKLARVQNLLEAAREVHSKNHLDQLLSRVLELAAKELEAHGSFLTSSSQVDTCTLVYGCLPPDWMRWTERIRTHGYASATLKNERGETLGFLIVCRAVPLSLEEQEFLESLALQCALALKNAQQSERMIEWERVQSDLAAARAIQRSLLPDAEPNIPGYSLTFRSTSCYEVGGDYIDVVPLARRRLMTVMADVAGKGLASALISMSFRANFRAISRSDLPLEEIAARLNSLHWQEGVEARLRYVTALASIWRRIPCRS